jgi:hypothetical protein
LEQPLLILFILALIGVAVFKNVDHRFDTDVLAILVGTIALMLCAPVISSGRYETHNEEPRRKHANRGYLRSERNVIICGDTYHIS